MDEIVEELARRASGVIVALVKPVKDKNDNSECFVCWHKGGFTLCCGLASRVNEHMLKQAERAVEYEDED